MVPLDAAAVLRLGGWGSRYAHVLFAASHDDVGIALIDSNGDVADLDLDRFTHSPNAVWHAGSSGAARTEGAGWSFEVIYLYGRGVAGSAIRVEYRGNESTVTTSEHAGGPSWRTAILMTPRSSFHAASPSYQLHPLQ
jgi:hypothetical protein